MLTPGRHRSFEHLDDPATDPVLRERSLRDVRRANTTLGGANAVLAELDRLLPTLGREVSLLDDALAHMECRVVSRFDAGDHMLFVGEVERATARDARPLLYYRGGYAQLER